MLGRVGSSYFSFYRTFSCKGRGDLFCLQQKQVRIFLYTLFFILNPQEPPGGFQYRVVENRRAVSQALRTLRGSQRLPRKQGGCPVYLTTLDLNAFLTCWA